MKATVITLCLLIAFALQPTFAFPEQSDESSSQSEAILGLQTDVENNEITIVVRSNGCTNIEDISVTFSEGKLMMKRLKPDNCKRMPFPKELVYSLEDLGLDPHRPFTVENRFVVSLLATTE